jgi:hypothetical protein
LEAFKNFADPGSGLDFPDQVLATEKITNTVITPFDWSEITQTIRNPLLPKEIISIQIVCRNVMPLGFSANKVIGKNIMEECPSGHPLKYGSHVAKDGAK